MELIETLFGVAMPIRTEKAVIYWGDETAVVEDGHWVRGYAPQGKTPVLATSSRRSGLALVSAISNQGLVRFRFIEQALNAALFLEFLGQLIADQPQKVFLILDNLKVHHAKLVTEWVGEHAEQIELDLLAALYPLGAIPPIK
ncbi:MAG: transposase [Candidatus Competibacteraceae bacterium]|nr:transposase [Candidatus Competibacteraceae bacterium]